MSEAPEGLILNQSRITRLFSLPQSAKALRHADAKVPNDIALRAPALAAADAAFRANDGGGGTDCPPAVAAQAAGRPRAGRGAAATGRRLAPANTLAWLGSAIGSLGCGPGGVGAVCLEQPLGCNSDLGLDLCRPAYGVQSGPGPFCAAAAPLAGFSWPQPGRGCYQPDYRR